MAINDQTKKIADKVAEFMSVDGESADIVVKEGAFEAALEIANEDAKTTITKDQYDAAFDVLGKFNAATGLATGNLAIPELAKPERASIDAMSATFKAGKGVKITQTISRQFETSVPGKDTPPITRYGRLNTEVHVQAAKAKSNGSLRAVRDELYEKGEELLKKDK